jgi:hypothetical protein
MAKFSLRRLLVQDFSSEDQDLVGKLATLINNALEQVSSAFSNGLTVKDNMAAMELDLAVAAPVNAANPIFFKNTTKAAIRMIICGNAVTAQGGIAPTGTPFFTFETSGNEVKITSITNLTAGSKYTLRVHCHN